MFVQSPFNNDTYNYKYSDRMTGSQASIGGDRSFPELSNLGADAVMMEGIRRVQLNTVKFTTPGMYSLWHSCTSRLIVL